MRWPFRRLSRREPSGLGSGGLGTTPCTSQSKEVHPMPPSGVKPGSKRARQYEHIKDSLEQRGRSEDRAEEIAARTVNKEKARHGESRTSSRLSKEDISS